MKTLFGALLCLLLGAAPASANQFANWAFHWPRFLVAI